MSRQKAIDNHCKNCIYDPYAGGTWRQQVEECTVTDCALYKYRPKSTVKLQQNEAEKREQPEGLRRHRLEQERLK